MQFAAVKQEHSITKRSRKQSMKGCSAAIFAKITAERPALEVDNSKRLKPESGW
jgi:hypothetical protein